MLDLTNKVGICIGANYNTHNIDNLQTLSAGACCASFSDAGHGYGLNLEGLLEFPLNQNIKTQFRFGFTSLSGELVSNNLSPIIYEDKSIDAVIEDRLDVSIKALRFQPSIQYNIIDNFYFHIGIGLTYIANNKVIYESTVLSPENVTIDGQRSNTSTENMDMNTILFDIIPGISYDFDVNRYLTLSPEIKYVYTISHLTADMDYFVNQVQFGLSLKFPAF